MAVSSLIIMEEELVYQMGVYFVAFDSADNVDIHTIDAVALD